MGQPARPTRLLPLMRDTLMRQHYSQNTVQTYTYWVRQYVLFHKTQHPRDLSVQHLEAFLTHLAVERHVSPNTQSQALNALVFLYRHVLHLDLGDIGYLRTQRRFKNIPTGHDTCSWASFVCASGSFGMTSLDTTPPESRD